MVAVTVIIHARNEAHQIERCIASCSEWAEETIVADMASSDGTPEIARKLGVKLLDVPFTDEFDFARNGSSLVANQPWILFLDADEVLTNEIKASIASLINEAPLGVGAFQLPFRVISFGRWIRHAGSWWPNYKSPPLLRRGRFHFSGRVHDPAIVDGQVIKHTPRSPDDAILHYSHPDITKYLDKLNRYTSLEALKLLKRTASWREAARRMGGVAKWYYDETEGSKDGRAGFFLSVLSGFYEAVTELKLMEIGESTDIPLSAEEFFLEAAQAARATPRVVPQWADRLGDLIPDACVAESPDPKHNGSSIQSSDGRFWITWPDEVQQKNLNVGAVLHENALAILGGGEVQAFETARWLGNYGVRTDLGVGRLPNEAPKLLHLYSLHHESLSEWLASPGTPYVVSPIYWDRAELELVAKRIKQLVAAATRISDFEAGYQSIRAEVSSASSSGQLITPLTPFQRQLVTGAKAILANGQAELTCLSRSLGEDILNGFFVPNGATIVPDSSQEVEGLPTEKFVVCVGRVEVNKNQLALALACRRMGVSLVLVGNVPDETYRAAVEIAGGSRVHWLGARPRNEVSQILRQAAVHCLPSLAETPGLANLEALEAGCALVCSDRGCEREYFDDTSIYCDPLSIDSITICIEQAMNEGPRPRESLKGRYTWQAAAEATAAIYRRVLG